jgi:hypothetical protein
MLHQSGNKLHHSHIEKRAGYGFVPIGLTVGLIRVVMPEDKCYDVSFMRNERLIEPLDIHSSFKEGVQLGV